MLSLVDYVLRAANHVRVALGDLNTEPGQPDSDLLPPPGGPWAYAHFKVLGLDPLPVWVPELSLELFSHAPTRGENNRHVC
jgi:hypothetical protein